MQLNQQQTKMMKQIVHLGTQLQNLNIGAPLRVLTLLKMFTLFLFLIAVKTLSTEVSRYGILKP